MGHVIVHALGHMPLFATIAGRAGPQQLYCDTMVKSVGTFTLNLEHPPTFEKWPQLRQKICL